MPTLASFRLHPVLPRSAGLLALLLTLTGCDALHNQLRSNRFASTPAPEPQAATPRAQALALRLSTDGRSLNPDSLAQANALLQRQGRIGAQVLTITPFNQRGAEFAPRLAQALQRNGAKAPQVLALSADAGSSGWDLELQSEALVLDDGRCQIADRDDWAMHPYRGVGSLGCATRSNLARMVSDPRDLSRPRSLDGGDGRAAAAAVRRYQEDDLKDLIDIDFSEED
jgi:pilus assembly protein CpaD